jgi:hypothetical protein
MKSESPLHECFAKIVWAETEINKLVPQIGALTATPRFSLPPPRKFPGDWPTRGYPSLYPTGIHKVASHIDSNGIEIWRFVAPDIPPALNVTVGAILHNLRSPLDQMLSAIALQKHSSANQVGFPFGRTRDEFKTALNKQKKPPDALKMIQVFKPYRVGGNALLHAIHALNTPDKHRPGLIPINLQTISNMDTVGVHGAGAILTLGPRTGLHFVVDMDGNFSQADKSKAPALNETIPGKPTLVLGSNVGNTFRRRTTRLYNQTGTKITDRIPNLADYIAKTVLPPGSPKDDMEIATTIPGTKFEVNVEPSFNVALGDIEGFEREPVVVVLHQMRQLVRRILQTFEKRFFK